MNKIMMSVGLSFGLMATTMFAECSKDNLEIQKAFGVQKQTEEAKIIDVKKMEQLDGFCTVAILVNGTDVDVNYINPEKKLVIGRGGIFKYTLKDGVVEPEIESLINSEIGKYANITAKAIETKTLNFLNSKEFMDSDYFKNVLLKQADSKKEYAIFTYSSDSCGNCNVFKDFVKEAKINYLYLPINEQDHQAHIKDAYMAKNMEFANELGQKLNIRLGTPTTIIYNLKSKKFVDFAVGANPQIIEKIEAIQKIRG